MANDEFVRVPRVPTVEMLQAASNAINVDLGKVESEDTYFDCSRAIYKTMLAAAPPESAQTEGDSLVRRLLPYLECRTAFQNGKHELALIAEASAYLSVDHSSKHTVCPQCGAVKEGV